MPVDRRTFRRRSNFVIARASELVRPLLSATASSITGRATDPGRWRRGVLLGADHIGDVLYNTASLPYLRAGLSNCEWWYLAGSPANQLLRNNPALAGVIERSGSSTIERVSDARFDVAICYNSASYSRDLMFAFRAGIPNRVAYVHKGFSGLVTYPVSIDYPSPYPAYFRALVSQLVNTAADWSLRPNVYPTASELADANRTWNQLQLSGEGTVVACFVTSRQPTGVWPLEYFGETIVGLRDAGIRVVLCGSATDASVLHSLRDSYCAGCPVNAGRLSLPALVAFLSKCAGVLSVDSGPRHLANAAGVPLFYFRNLRSSAVETGNYLATETDLAPAGVEFIPPARQIDWLERIRPDIVAETITRALLRR